MRTKHAVNAIVRAAEVEKEISKGYMSPCAIKKLLEAVEHLKFVKKDSTTGLPRSVSQTV